VEMRLGVLLCIISITKMLMFAIRTTFGGDFSIAASLVLMALGRVDFGASNAGMGLVALGTGV
jgi:hypothetical protein